MRVLAVVFPEPGHFHVFVGVAQALERAGHDVAFFCAEDLGPRLRRAGLRAACFSPPATRSPAPPAGSASRSEAYAERLRKPAWARRWYAQVLLGAVPAQVEALREVVRSFAPDVLCADPSLYAAGIVATQEKVLWASVAPLLVMLSPAGFRSIYHDCVTQLDEQREALFRSAGVELSCTFGEMISPWLNTVFTTEAFVPRVETARAHYLGPSSALGARGDEPDFPWDRLDPRRPLVYASFGTQVSPASQVFEAIAHAVGPRGPQLVMALGDRADDAFVTSLPDHVIAVRYAPQRELLARAAVMITHGGVNGVTEAVQHGVPMLVIPIAHEQPLQAHFVERAGVGASLALEDATAVRCAEELERLLAPGAHRQRADELRADYARTDAASSLVRALAELASSTRVTA